MPFFFRDRRARARLVLPAVIALGLAGLCARLSAQAQRNDVAEELDQVEDALPLPEPAPKPGPAAAPTFRKAQFRRGDADANGKVEITDPIAVLNYLFKNGPLLSCLEAANANGDGQLDVSDAVYGLNFLFRATAPPPAPGPDECGVDPRDAGLGCAEYARCPDDFPLVAHALNRITFGGNLELYSAIQTRADLVAYIEEQLAAPDGYDQTVHEPGLHGRVEALRIGFPGDRTLTANAQPERLAGMLLRNAFESEWQLLHVLAQFWNNHFHTQIDALRENFFGRGGRGGGALRATEPIFDAADADASGGITEAEWTAFRDLHPTAIAWTEFNRGRILDGTITLQEFLDQRQIAYWKYARGRDQLAIAADMERREYDLFRGLAFGKFRDLLEASSKSVAMLIYLNGFENTVRQPNENQAREFFELFGIGVDHVYTQRDIEELARALTGWTVGWVERAGYDPADINFQGHPESPHFLINQREPAPLPFPTGENWSDEAYTWAFVLGPLDRRGVRTDAHDWGRKDLFLQRYGGVDSLGNPLDPADELAIPANTGARTIAGAVAEFDLVLDRVVRFRDCAKFISTKLIQLFVTDDLSLLKKTYPMPPELEAAFVSVDADGSGMIDSAEWEEPIPLSLPNGRPPEIFQRLDGDGDGLVTRTEYREPDLLLDCIRAWRDSDGSIREVVRAILLSDEFLGPAFYRAKVRTPFEVVTSTVRALGGTPTENNLLQAAADLNLAGMELFHFADPTGESELGFDWMHTVGLLERLKYINRGANPERVGDARFSWNATGFQRDWVLDTPERAVDFFALLLLNGDVLDEQRALAIEAYAAAPTVNRRIPATAAYLLSLPQFQKQ